MCIISKSEDILGGIYYVHEYFLSDLKEGTHKFKAVDRFGQESNLKLTIDNTKPSVTGVKNGKTYKNGIASAKLNGKKISSGIKVSKNKSYTLKVIDNAGNVNTVKFKINGDEKTQK